MVRNTHGVECGQELCDQNCLLDEANVNCTGIRRHWRHKGRGGGIRASAVVARVNWPPFLIHADLDMSACEADGV